MGWCTSSTAEYDSEFFIFCFFVRQKSSSSSLFGLLLLGVEVADAAKYGGFAKFPWNLRNLSVRDVQRNRLTQVHIVAVNVDWLVSTQVYHHILSNVMSIHMSPC